ncbi:hypothetical protein [Halobacteriovorax marinus]|uniref:hypothetical protein n=1 Tax=Halobacteriovorax marinus TaxID=97084 RepID=UPI003A92A3EF
MKRKLLITLLTMTLSLQIGAQAVMDTKYGPDHDPSNLTDQDKDLSENFVHDQRVQRIYEEECTADSDTEDACLGNKADPKFMGMKSSMVSALSKAYVMIMGTAGGELSTTKSEWAKSSAEKAKEAEAASSADANNTGNNNANGEKDEQKDYCKYIPMATEAIGMFNTTSDQQTLSSLPTKEDTQQRDSLLKAAANHDSRAKTAKIQTTGWGAGTACYVAMLSMSSASWGSTGNLMKLGASALLTSFYYNQIGDHEDYADKTRAIANKLPGKGDCNPITERECFCEEPTSKKRADYAKYCVPQINGKPIAYTSEIVTCVDNQLKEDPDCKCAQTNTCIDEKVMTTITGFDGQSFLSSPALSDFSSLSRGELTGKNLSSTQTNLNNALAKLRELDSKVELEPNTILTPAQKSEAKFLQEMGLPANLATKVATTSVSPEAKKNMAKFNGNFSNSRRNYSNSNRKKKSNVLTFSGGDGINSNQRKATTKKPDFLSRFGLKKKKKKNNQAVLKFAEQAEKQAQISKNSDRKIFDIISRRYQVSGWRRLEYIK